MGIKRLQLPVTSVVIEPVAHNIDVGDLKSTVLDFNIGNSPRGTI
jgi:hypothetical protein